MGSSFSIGPRRTMSEIACVSVKEEYLEVLVDKQIECKDILESVGCKEQYSRSAFFVAVAN